MPAERIKMRKLREIVRLLAAGGLSKREIADRVGVAASTVREAAKKISAAGLSWPLQTELSDAELEALLYKNAGKKQGHRRIPEPDWAVIHHELKRKHVTLTILWEEYIAAHADVAIPAFANSTGRLRTGCRSRCGKAMRAARSFLSITPETPFPSSSTG